MLETERIVTFSEAAAILPKFNGRRPHTSTVWRWARRGCRGIRLEVRRLGGRFVTSIEALDRFGQALAEADADRFDRPADPPTAKPPTDRQRERSIERSEQVLRTGGIL